MVSNGSSLDCLGLEPVAAYNDNGCSIVKDHVVDDVKQRNLFYQLLPVYLKENCSQGIVPPVPVLLGDGQMLDLYKLYLLVKENVGYAAVSIKGLWGYVTKELGLDVQVLAAVKLVHDKYLNDFEAWLRKTFEEKIFSRNGNHGCGWGFKSFPLDLEKELRGLLRPNLKDKNDELVELESQKIRNHIDLVNDKDEANLLDTKNQNNICKDVQNVHGDDGEKLYYGVKDDLPTFDKEVAENEFNYRKRKWEDLSEMLNWIKDIAKQHPLDPVIPPIPKPSKWKEYKGRGFSPQVLRTREVLSVRWCEEPKAGPASLQKQMHPSMYEDEVALGHHSRVKLRCSGRMPTSVKSRLCSCCNSCSADGKKLTSSVNTEAEKCPREKTTTTVDSLTAKITGDQSGDEFRVKQVSIGPRSQAEVPEWTGVVSESDSKWLGTQVWPSEHDSKPAIETDLIGRGREDDECSCKSQGSVECVRLHIAESRMKLKHELGPLFYSWGFDRMGEEVSLQWKTEEEKRFKDLMRLHVPSENKSFWTNSSKYFPKKMRRNLVSYYFNEFVIQRRIFQNRVTPKRVDSDDDEVDFGSFDAGFGMEALNVPPDTDFMECSENKQVTDLE